MTAASASSRLVLEIEVPDFFVDDITETLQRVGIDPTPEAISEEVEVAMGLATHEVGLTFLTHEGDAPQTFVQAKVGRIVNFKVVPSDIPF